MKRRLTLCVAMIVSLSTIGALYFSARTAADSAPAKTANTVLQNRCNNPASRIPLTGKTCGAVQDLQISCYVPSDLVPPLPAPLTSSPNFNVTQRSADIFSSQEFIPLNLPAIAGPRGNPDP